MEGSSKSDRRFFGPQEVADQLGTSRGFVYSLMEAGDLRSLKLGGRRIIPASEIERLVGLAEAPPSSANGGDINVNR
jgi:excisionase family DNA binding protein